LIWSPMLPRLPAPYTRSRTLRQTRLVVEMCLTTPRRVIEVVAEASVHSTSCRAEACHTTGAKPSTARSTLKSAHHGAGRLTQVDVVELERDEIC
jgi:hypothetical protein